MSSSGCLRCLSRPTLSQLTSSLSKNRAQAFSTTSERCAKATGTGLKAQQAKAAHLKSKGKSNTLKIKKKAFVKTWKSPAPGERKAMRKRIVLSNTNALEVLGMEDLTSETVFDEQMVGRVLGLDGKTVDSLRAAEAFKTTQSWGFFRRPGLLVRKESVRLAQQMVDREASKETWRLVLDGDRGSGKSMMLIHAMATAFMRGWIVLNIPDAQELTIARTIYGPIPNTEPVVYTQNDYAATWLARISKSNIDVLEKLVLTQQHNLPIPIPSDTTLSRLCELGARDPDVAWPIFQAFWAEITAPGRPPILMTMDSLQYAMQESQYRSASFELIHAHDLAIIKHFTDYLSAEKTLPNGGAIIAATQRSHANINKMVDLRIKQAEDRQESRKQTPEDPYEKRYDARAAEVLGSIEVLRLSGLSKEEARGLMEYWAQSGVLRTLVDERVVAEKWALAGNGIVGEIERGALTMRI